MVAVHRDTHPNHAKKHNGPGGSLPGPKFLAIGRILKPHGIKGGVLVEVMTDFPGKRFSGRKTVYLGTPDSAEPYDMICLQAHGERYVVRFEGYSTRTDVEGLRGLLIQVPISEAITLPEDEYYLYQLMGLQVFTEDGELLGEVIDILSTGANEVYVVRGERGEVLIPAIEDVVRKIDLEGGRLIIRPIEGLL